MDGTNMFGLLCQKQWYMEVRTKVLCPNKTEGVLAILSRSYEKIELGEGWAAKSIHMGREEERGQKKGRKYEEKRSGRKEEEEK